MKTIVWKERICRHALALLALLILCGCGAPFVEGPPGTAPEEEREEETVPPVAFALAYYPDGGLDPLSVTSATNLAILPLMYEGLFETGPDFVTRPALCLRAEANEDKTVWTLFLRGGVTFSDGTGMTAQSVRDCLEQMRQGGGVWAGRLADVTQIEAGEGKVNLTLRAPNARLPALLDLPIFLPGKLLLGTGPYRLEGGRLVARGDWWRGETPPVTEILLHEVTSADDLVLAFDAGQVTLLTTDLTATNASGYAGNYELWRYPTTTMLYIGFQTVRGLCADAAVRRAVSLAVDRPVIAERVLAGHAIPAVLPVHPLVYPPSGVMERKVGEAAELLDSSGWVAGEGARRRGREDLRPVLVVNDENPFHVDVAQQIVRDLAEVGVEVELRGLNWAEYRRAVGAGEFDLYLGAIRMLPDFDLSALLRAGEGLNYGGWASEQTNLLLDGYRAGEDGTALYGVLEAEVPFAPLCFRFGALLTRWGRVKGAEPAPHNPFWGLERWEVG